MFGSVIVISLNKIIKDNKNNNNNNK